MQSLASVQSSQLSMFPDVWEIVETLQETCVIAQVEFRVAGFTAQRSSDGVMVSGSSCAWDRDPADTAWYELLERISLVTSRSLPKDTRWCLRDVHSFAVKSMSTSKQLFADSPKPELWVPAKSNGVAMGQDLQAATRHGLLEAIERHLVLASWYGAIAPQFISHHCPDSLAKLQEEYRIEHYSMGKFSLNQSSTTATAVGTFLWPRDEKKPVIYGFGAGLDSAAAIERSLKEAVQRLCFLYDSEEADSLPDFRPTPDFHQDYFLQASQQDALRRWLKGDHFQEKYAKAVVLEGDAHWVDLTAHDRFPGKVVQVFVPGTLPLMFGRFQPPGFPDLDPQLYIHPIM